VEQVQEHLVNKAVNFEYNTAGVSTLIGLFPVPAPGAAFHKQAEGLLSFPRQTHSALPDS
jgi:hypothetical protein